jgi:hypothetical protein
MKTGKFIVSFACIAALVVSLSGCFSLSAKITVDPDLPIESSAMVMIPSVIHVKEYNGINVKELWYPKNEFRDITVIMPAGETHLLFDMYAGFVWGNTTYNFKPKDVVLKYNFEAGKEYTIGVTLSDKKVVVLAIWDGFYPNELPRGDDLIVKSWELGRF